MREIKFRAWNKVKNEMEQIAYSKLLIQPSGSVCIQQDDNTLADVSHDYEIMQFTGLYDKNKKPIYEGDVLQEYNGKFSEVMWLETEAGFYSRNKDGYCRKIAWNSLVEVVGDAYRNPELLK